MKIFKVLPFVLITFLLASCASTPAISSSDLMSNEFELTSLSFSSFYKFEKNGKDVFPSLAVDKVVGKIEEKYGIIVKTELFSDKDKALAQINPSQTQGWNVRSDKKYSQNVSLSFILSPNFPEMYVEIEITYIDKAGKVKIIKDFDRIYDWKTSLNMK